MIQQQPIPSTHPAASAAFTKSSLIVLAVWQVLLLVMVILSSLQVNQLSSDLAALKQQANLLNHFEQTKK